MDWNSRSPGPRRCSCPYVSAPERQPACSGEAREQLSEPQQLLSAMETQNLGCYGSVHSRGERIKIARQQSESSDHRWPFEHLVRHAEDLPQWMVAEKVVLPARVESGPQD